MTMLSSVGGHMYKARLIQNRKYYEQNRSAIPVSTDGLVCYHPLDELIAFDYCGNTCTYPNAEIITAGGKKCIHKKSVATGSPEACYMTFDHLQPQNDYTICVWCLNSANNTTAAAQYFRIGNSDYAYILLRPSYNGSRSTGHLVWDYEASANIVSVRANKTVNNMTWFFLTGTRSGNVFTSYINAEQITQKTLEFTNLPIAKAVVCGSNAVLQSCARCAFCYNRALTAEEIADVYRSTAI